MHLAALSTTLWPIAVTALSKSIQTQTTDTTVFGNLQLYAEYSAIAYCSASYLKTTGAPIVCPTTVCPMINTVSTEIVDSFTNLDAENTTGVIMLDHARQLTIISFRGTHTSQDLLTDVEFIFERANDICSGCQVHSGFLNSWLGVRDTIIADWQGLQAQYGSYHTVVTGHSLGGALAHLCGAGLKSISTAPISLFTYGSPRVGNQAFATHINSVFGANNYRVTHLNDAVPRLPPRWVGFVHSSPEYHITAPHIPGALSADSTTLLAPTNMFVNPIDVTVIPGPESPMGNLGYSCTNVAMHFEYFGPISGCNPPDLRQEDFEEAVCGDLLLCCNDLF